MSATVSDITVARAARPVARTLAAVAGVVVLAGGTILTVGMALVGMLGMGITTWLARRRARQATLFQWWLGAAIAVAVAFAIVALGSFALASRGGLRQAMSEATAARKSQPRPEPPAWLRRITPTRQPDAATQAQADRLAASPVFVWYTMILGIGFGGGLVGIVAGSVGWAGLTLLLFAIRGYWGPGLAPANLLLEGQPVGPVVGRSE